MEIGETLNSRKWSGRFFDVISILTVEKVFHRFLHIRYLLL